MKLRVTFGLFLFLMLPSIIAAQERAITVNSESTAAPASVRFEIIQVQHLRETLLLKLDKYTGEVFEFARNRDLIKDRGQAYAWQLTRWDSRPAVEALDTQRVNFQIFAGTHNDNSVYLLNVNNGDVWTMLKDPAAEKESYWVLSKLQRK